MSTGKKIILHEGKTINVNFGSIKQLRIEDHLGSGGYAEAWKATDIKTSKSYVLKHIVVKDVLKGKEREAFIIRIKNEASIKIPSKYIVKTFGLDEFHPGNYAILFEYISGSKDLKDWLRENGDIAWKDRKKLYLEILKGVNDAHSMNIIHRDLKPENVLITKENIPKIIDFGVAKFKDSSVSVTGEMKGTLPYMDPFVFLKGIKYVDARCDVYALGIILYEITQKKAMNPWLANGIEFPEFVRHITSGKKHIMEIDAAYDFDEDPGVKEIIIKSTFFDMEERVGTVQQLSKLLDGDSMKKPVIEVDFSSTTPFLVVEDGSAKGAMYPLVITNGKQRQLGRKNLDATNDSISRAHAMIHRNGNRYFLYDTTSRRGTFFNGSKLKPGKDNMVEIHHGDRIRFADLWTRFVFLKK